MTERVLPAIYINIVYTAGVITQKSFHVGHRHAVDEHQCRQCAVGGFILLAYNQSWHTIDLCMPDTPYIFEYHLPDGEELSVLIEIV